jgi:2-phospho-L-lactate/phosphoenolpyruvate guanylyltransferase
MRTVAVVPVKTFSRAKQRLAAGLSEEARGTLARAMLADVLGALGRTKAVESLLVVTADPAAEALAGAAGARVIPDPAETGQSAAAILGIAEARGRGAERVLLAPGDCPTVDPGEVDAVLAGVQRRRVEVVIVPDRHGSGTNALVLCPPEAIEPGFGEGSRERHERRARDAGRRHAVEQVASLALDVDTPGDLAALRERLARAASGAHTRAALAELAAAGAPPAGA